MTFLVYFVNQTMRTSITVAIVAMVRRGTTIFKFLIAIHLFHETRCNLKVFYRVSQGTLPVELFLTLYGMLQHINLKIGTDDLQALSYARIKA